MKRGSESKPCNGKEKLLKENPLCERIFDEFLEGNLSADLFSEVMIAESLTASELNSKVVEYAVHNGCERIPELFGTLTEMTEKILERRQSLENGIRETEKQILTFLTNCCLIFEIGDITDTAFRKVSGGLNPMAIVDMKKILPDKTKKKYSYFLDFMSEKQHGGDYYLILYNTKRCLQCRAQYFVSKLKSGNDCDPALCVACLKDYQVKSQTLEEFHLQLSKLNFNAKALTQ